ncbi:hypothetical protein FOYG_12726 [Fusarium oxysporum NRRL 32931]|uniref:Uncharacterized protein n=1 Tax=Fusarium oxysporum NRRL 32931 TaxID=660029 RepID=W9HSJ1_FUSOX|nr:hypothetical protein FOYG_12726 [Fusarium oxysporum NRRL 32931]
MSDDRDLVTLRDPSHKKVARLRKWGFPTPIDLAPTRTAHTSFDCVA